MTYFGEELEAQVHAGAQPGADVAGAGGDVAVVRVPAELPALVAHQRLDLTGYRQWRA